MLRIVWQVNMVESWLNYKKKIYLKLFVTGLWLSSLTPKVTDYQVAIVNYD